MENRIQATKALTPQELSDAISDLDFEKLSLTDVKIVKPKQGKHPPYFYLNALRRKLYDLYVEKNELPTLKTLLRALKEEIQFKGSTRSLRKLMKKDGFHIVHKHRKGKKHSTKKGKRCCCRSNHHTKQKEQQD